MFLRSGRWPSPATASPAAIPGAAFAYVAGSIMRGEGTTFSDIDLVVAFPSLQRAWRESFTADGFPVEAFVHDPQTLAHYLHQDADSGYPIMANMVATGCIVGSDIDSAGVIQAKAASMLATGPKPLAGESYDMPRYQVTDLADDLRGDRPPAEVAAIAALLYQKLADLILIGRGAWTGRGKWAPRLLKKLDAHWQPNSTRRSRWRGRATAPNSWLWPTGSLACMAAVISRGIGRTRRWKRAAWNNWYRSRCRVLKIGRKMLENEFKGALQSAVRRTARLRLRPPVDGDADFLTRLFSRSELVAHRPVPRPDSPEESAARLARDIGHWKDHGFGRWAVESNGVLMGFGGVTVSKEFDGLNLSYHLQPESWGHGYATELVRESLTFAFDDLQADRVIGLVRTANAASRRILEKCGFVFEREVMLHGAPTNMYATGSFRT